MILISFLGLDTPQINNDFKKISLTLATATDILGFVFINLFPNGRLCSGLSERVPDERYHVL